MVCQQSLGKGSHVAFGIHGPRLGEVSQLQRASSCLPRDAGAAAASCPLDNMGAVTFNTLSDNLLGAGPGVVAYVATVLLVERTQLQPVPHLSQPILTPSLKTLSTRAKPAVTTRAKHK